MSSIICFPIIANHTMFYLSNKYSFAITRMIMNLFTLGSWQNYGVDFTGGSLVQVRCLDDVAAGPVRSAVPGARFAAIEMLSLVSTHGRPGAYGPPNLASGISRTPK